MSNIISDTVSRYRSQIREALAAEVVALVGRWFNADEDDARFVLEYWRRFWLSDKLATGPVNDLTPRELLVDIRTGVEFWSGMLEHAGTFAQLVRQLRQLRRCACPDNPEAFTADAKWNKKTLRWYVSGFVGGIPQVTQVALVAESFSKISAVCGLEFVQASTQNEADMVVGVGRGRADNFDGPMGTLAWFYLPNGADVQIYGKRDLDESWVGRVSDASGSQIALEVVDPHEFLHGVGLSHTNVPGSLMNPTYNPRIKTPQAWDIAELKRRYGEPRSPSPVPSPAPSQPAPSRWATTLSMRREDVAGELLTMTLTGRWSGEAKQERTG